MGYVRQSTLSLTFDESTEFDGLRVRVRRPSIRQVTDWYSLDTKDDSANLAVDKIGQAVQLLAALLVDWNLEDEQGIPVPVTAEGVWSQDAPLIGRILGEAMKASLGVSAPLADSSLSGVPFPEASIPMEASSPSQPS